MHIHFTNNYLLFISAFLSSQSHNYEIYLYSVYYSLFLQAEFRQYIP